MTPPPAAAPKKRWWRSRRLWIVAACLLLLAFASPYAIPLYENWQLDRDLASAIAETDRLDPGWRSADLWGKTEDVPDSENAALLFRKIDRLLGEKHYTPEFKALPIPEGVVPKSNEHFDWVARIDESLDDPPEVNRLNDEQVRALASEQKQYREAIDEARRLRLFRKCQFPASIPDQRRKNARAGFSAVRLLRFDIFQRCEAEDFNGALDSVDALLAVVRLQADEPDRAQLRHREFAVMSACQRIHRILAQGEPDSKRLADLQAQLLKEAGVPALLMHARTRRAEQADVFWQWRDKKMSDEERKEHVLIWASIWKKEPEPKDRPWYVQWFRKERPVDPRVLQTSEMQQFNRFVEFAKKPIDEQFDFFGEFVRQERKEFGGVGIFPTYQNTAHSVFQTHMMMSTTRTAIALERYRQATGDWPKSLDRLVPTYLAEVPTDHYARKPLVYRRVEKGCLVYSVGEDRADNGGKLRREPGEDSWGRDGVDIGVRLWDPAHRRQPPLPAVRPREPQRD